MKEKILIVSGGKVPTKNIIDMKRISELKKLILKYDKQYYEEGTSDISDAEYDRLYEEYLLYEKKYPELKDMDDSPTKRVGAGEYAGQSTLLPKFHHKSPLLSIPLKSKQLSDLKAFYESVGGEGTEVIIEPKLDGITCNINYEDGKFVNAATRGNGYIGDLITENFVNSQTVYPESLTDNVSLEIRGEAIIPYDFFKKHLSKDYSNPRNTVSGLMRSIDYHDVQNKGIQVMFYDIGTYKNMELKDNDSDNIDSLKCSGFQSLPVIKVNTWERLKEVVENKMDNMIKEIDGYNILYYQPLVYPQAMCDGLVIKVNSLKKREKLGMTEKGPKWAFAYKFKPLQKATQISHVEWNVGKTGKITPTAIFKEISLGGVKITRATLNNIDYMKNLPVLEEERSVWIVEPYDTWGELIIIPFTRPLKSFELQALQSGDILRDTKYDQSQGEEECKRIVIGKVDKEKKCFWIKEPKEWNGECYFFENDRYQLVNQNRGLQMDDTIIVERSNDVIPKIIAIQHHNNCAYPQDWEQSKIIQERENSFNPPQKCPVCGHSLQQIGPQLFCQNPTCQAQLLGKLEQFVSRDAMNIVGMGDSIIEEFVNRGFIKEFSDIYQLEKYKDDILHINKFGIKKYNNLIKSIQNSKNPELSAFIYALNIPLVGKKTAKDLAKSYKDLHSFMNADYENLISIEDISDITAQSILKWLQDTSHQKIIQNLLDVGITIKVINEKNNNIAFHQQNFVITGTLSKPRKYYQELIEKGGGKVVGSVSKKTHYVLLGENAGSKEKKARDLMNKGVDIKIIDEKQFMNMLGE